MTLLDEVQAARKKVVTDGYEMSLGELINLYRDDELKIDPVFQRLFRWDDERKTRFIEIDPSRYPEFHPFSSTKMRKEYGSLLTVCSVSPPCSS